MVRYPDIAFLYLKNEETEGVPKLDLDGNAVAVSSPEKTKIAGRYEPNSGNKDLDYSGKFYTSLFGADNFTRDGGFLEFQGVEFTVVHLVKFQRHVEIWLE